MTRLEKWESLSYEEQQCHRLDRQANKQLVKHLQSLVNEKFELTDDQKIFLELHKSIPGSQRRKIYKQKKGKSEKIKINHYVEKREEKLLEFTEIIMQAKKIVCIDVEQHEYSHAITEVGITEYFPGTNSTFHWHYIINEVYHQRNRKRLPDNKDNFDFGKSVRISIDKLKQVIDGHLEFACYVAGHAFDNDVKMLQDYIVIDKTKILDTQKLAKYYFATDVKYSLVKILELLKIRNENLHNGGNDAAYTMQALLAMQLFKLKGIICPNKTTQFSIAS